VRRRVPDLTFAVDGAAAAPYAAVPTLAFTVRITNGTDEAVEAVSLQCQIRIEASRRTYSGEEKRGLADLFGAPERFGQTVRSFLWTHAATQVRGFTGSTSVDLPVACTFDFEVISTKYLHALETGEVPLLLLFSGTVFFRNDEGALQVSQISWDSEVSYRMPIAAWHGVMNMYYPNSAWLYLHRDAFERLYRFKTENGIPTWERVIERLLPDATEAPRVPRRSEEPTRA
jgi:Family of unknown function (DUF6084)